MSSDTLKINGLRYHAFHGVYEQEKTDGNIFEVDLIIRINLKKSAESDDLKYGIDYVEVQKLVSEIMNGPSKNLIETLAKTIGDKLFSVFEDIRALKVIVRKMNPPMPVSPASAEVVMKWKR